MTGNPGQAADIGTTASVQHVHDYENHQAKLSVFSVHQPSSDILTMGLHNINITLFNIAQSLLDLILFSHSFKPFAHCSVINTVTP
jgi:hypothetical protein